MSSILDYLDFSKAFDSVCHAKLLSKLCTFGIDGPLLQWFTNYLSGLGCSKRG